MQRKWRPSRVSQCMWHYAFVGAMSIQAFVGQKFPCERETSNSSDRYAASCPRMLKPLVLYLTIRCSNCLFRYTQRLIEALWGLVVYLLAEGISKEPSSSCVLVNEHVYK